MPERVLRRLDEIVRQLRRIGLQAPLPVNTRQGGRFTDGDKNQTVSQAIIQLLETKKNSGRRAVYISSLGQYLKRFERSKQGRHIRSITTAEVEAWLSQFSGHSRATWLSRLSTLFGYAVRKGWMERNPCDAIERIITDSKLPAVLTPAQVRSLLDHAPEKCKPYLILGVFAGIRPGGELLKLQWEHIDLEAGTVSVVFPKVRKHRRIVTLEPVAIRLLKPLAKASGPVSPSASTIRRCKRAMRSALGFAEWPSDILRHTAASYLLALHKDAGRVALQLGNSPSILLTHYHNPISKAQCSEFWSIGS